MGRSQGACFAAPHLQTLGWISPQIVTQSMLPVNQVVNFVVNASTRGGPANGQPGRTALMVRSWRQDGAFQMLFSSCSCNLLVVSLVVFYAWYCMHGIVCMLLYACCWPTSYTMALHLHLHTVAPSPWPCTPQCPIGTFPCCCKKAQTVSSTPTLPIASPCTRTNCDVVCMNCLCADILLLPPQHSNPPTHTSGTDGPGRGGLAGLVAVLSTSTPSLLGRCSLCRCADTFFLFHSLLACLITCGVHGQL